jgi:hypothetical protein
LVSNRCRFLCKKEIIGIGGKTKATPEKPHLKDKKNTPGGRIPGRLVGSPAGHEGIPKRDSKNL